MIYDITATYTAINIRTENDLFMSHDFGQIRQDTNHEKGLNLCFNSTREYY